LRSLNLAGLVRRVGEEFSGRTAMADICQETALRMYEICKGESREDDPEETVRTMALAVHEAMFRAGYCGPRCDGKECRQTT
jgi:hypothetical protein